MSLGTALYSFLLDIVVATILGILMGLPDSFAADKAMLIVGILLYASIRIALIIATYDNGKKSETVKEEEKEKENV